MNSSKKEYYKASVRDNHRCILCGCPYIHRHHIIFRSHFGADIEQNIVCLCVDCHMKAHNEQHKYQDMFIEYIRGYYGMLTINDLKKKGKYSNFKFSN